MTLSTYWHNLVERGKIHFGPLQVQVDYSYEEEPLESLFPEESAEWYAKTAKAVERSDMPYVVVRAKVFLDGVPLADNNLGGMLFDSWEELELSMTQDDHGLIAETVQEARDQWDRMIQLMSTQPKVVA
jgi:hypothetical protein